MVRTAVVIGWIAMARQHNFRLQLRHARGGSGEIVNLKPEKDAIPMREFGIADAAMMVLHLPAVQLKNEPAARNEPFILGSAMIASQAEQPLIPAAAGLYVAHANQRLWTHRKFRGHDFSVCTSTE